MDRMGALQAINPKISTEMALLWVLVSPHDQMPIMKVVCVTAAMCRFAIRMTESS
jgi:hypothetical protein